MVLVIVITNNYYTSGCSITPTLCLRENIKIWSNVASTFISLTVDPLNLIFSICKGTIIMLQDILVIKLGIT